MKSLSFSKYHGNGNDFILIDDREGLFGKGTFNKALIRKICHRNLGVGADGIIFFQPSAIADAKTRIFNKDGSEATSCGNGLCCFIRFLVDLGIKKSTYSIETVDTKVSGSLINDKIMLFMQDPKVIEKRLKIDINENKYEVTHIDSGVGHIVSFVDDIENINVALQGKKLRNHSFFEPQGVNVNFAFIDKNKIRARTYEKGIEAETYACGTGAIAMAIAANLLFNTSPPFIVQFKYGDIEINFDNLNKSVTNVKLTTSVNFVYKGSYLLN